MAQKKSAGAPAWMVTFADLMSLLVTFFVLILSFSIMDMQQYYEVAGSIREAFGFQDETLKAGVVELDGTPFMPAPRNMVPVPLAVVTLPHSDTPDASRGNLEGDGQTDAYEDLINTIVERLETGDAAAGDPGLPADSDGLEGDEGVGPGQRGDSGTLGVDGTEVLPGDSGERMAQGLGGEEPMMGLEGEDISPERRRVEEALAEVDPEALSEVLQQRAERQRVMDLLRTALAPELEEEGLQISGAGDSVTITFRDRVAFGSGVADLRSDFTDALDRLAEVLAQQEGRIIVSGHTDSIPISTARFRSNWDLSTARAVSVVQYWDENDLLPADRMAAIGYADTIPVASNDEAEGRALNRRVEVEVRVGDPRITSEDFGLTAEPAR